MSHGGASTRTLAPPRGASASPKRLSCEAWASACSAASSARPTEASRRARFVSSASKAPARTSASTTRRLTMRLSTRLQKSNEIGERLFAARLEDRVDRALAGAAHRAQAVAQDACVDRHEAVLGGVHVGRQDGEAVRDAVLVELAHLVGIVHHRGKVGGDERRGVVRLHVRGLVGEQRVGRGVRLVEAVAGELLHQVEELHRLGVREPAFFSAPATKISRCWAISSGFFLPIARRRRSAPPSE